MVPTLNGYLELHSCELFIIGALFFGLALGMWTGFALGKDRRYYKRRDANGRFIKRSISLQSLMRKQTWEPEEAK